MKLLNSKNIEKGRTAIDQQSIFYIFGQIIRTEYGRLGAENIVPVFFKERKIFLKAGSQNWANEIWINRANIVSKVNQQLGSEEVVDIVMIS